MERISGEVAAATKRDMVANLHSKTSKHRSHVMIIALHVPKTIVVVICEPRGLNNPITMGIKTSKA